MLYYCPLECYKERYTMQWSAPKTGWLERNWNEFGIDYRRIDSLSSLTPIDAVKHGVVLSPNIRTRHTFEQTIQLVDMLCAGTITDDDVIYFDDFWHPGIEALPYTCDQLGIHPKLFAFCHAQSVDQYDFTYRMRRWMRSFEIGIGHIMSGIFVNSDLLRTLLLDAGIGAESTVHVIGHIFSEDEVRSRFPKRIPARQNSVVFTSRWDDEKNPMLFLKIVKQYLQHYDKWIVFKVCTSAPKLRSNNPQNLTELRSVMRRYPDHVLLLEGLSKEDYYVELLKAKVQINTASQDWVSIALLEASVAGCWPLYPNFRSFPQAFRGDNKYMYKVSSIDDACSKLYSIMSLSNNDGWSEQAQKSRAWIHTRHNLSWARMINIMAGEAIINTPQYA